MKPLKFTSKKEAGKSHYFVNRKLMEQALFALPPGRYDWTIEKHRRKKSNPQLAYYYGAVLPLFLEHLNDAGWEFESIEEVDLWCKSQWADREILNRDTGQLLKVPALKRDFTTCDMMAFIDKIRNYDAEYLGGFIPEPETQMKINNF